MLKTGTGSNFYRRMLGPVGLLTLGLLTSNITNAQSTERYRPMVGQPHADFSLPSIDDGEAMSLSDFAGKKVLLFHFASW